MLVPVSLCSLACDWEHQGIRHLVQNLLAHTRLVIVGYDYGFHTVPSHAVPFLGHMVCDLACQ